MNIERLRPAALSQEKLGQRLSEYLNAEWSRQAVSAATKGRRAFTAAELVALARALDTTVFELLRSDEPVRLPNGRELSTDELARVLLTESQAVDEHRQTVAWQRLEDAAQLEQDRRSAARELGHVLEWLRGEIRRSPGFRVRVQEARDEVRDRALAERMPVWKSDVALARQLGQRPPPDPRRDGPSTSFEYICDELLKEDGDSNG